MSKKKWQKVTNKTLLLPSKYVWQVIYHHLFQAIPTSGCRMSSMENNLKLLSKHWLMISNSEGWVWAAGPMVLVVVHIECIHMRTHLSVLWKEEKVTLMIDISSNQLFCNFFIRNGVFTIAITIFTEIWTSFSSNQLFH